MEAALPVVVVAVVALAAVVAVVGLASGRSAYDEIGRGGLSLGDGAGHAPGGADTPAERDAEVREDLEARNARRRARGQPELDVDAELRRLTAPVADPALVAEVRQLVEARNERRVAQGRPPLDVEAEVRRRLRDAGA